MVKLPWYSTAGVDVVGEAMRLGANLSSWSKEEEAELERLERRRSSAHSEALHILEEHLEETGTHYEKRLREKYRCDVGEYTGDLLNRYFRIYKVTAVGHDPWLDFLEKTVFPKMYRRRWRGLTYTRVSLLRRRVSNLPVGALNGGSRYIKGYLLGNQREMTWDQFKASALLARTAGLPVID